MIIFIVHLAQVKLKSKGKVSMLKKCKADKVDANYNDKSEEKEKKERIGLLHLLQDHL